MLCPFWIWNSFRFQGGYVCPLSMLLTDDGSEVMGFGNLLYICKYEDTGVQCYSRMHSMKATALL